jgi:hypothetical protein
MIRIYKYGEVQNSEIFARDNISPDVEGVVSAIIAETIAIVYTATAFGTECHDDLSLSCKYSF